MDEIVFEVGHTSGQKLNPKSDEFSVGDSDVAHSLVTRERRGDKRRTYLVCPLYRSASKEPNCLLENSKETAVEDTGDRCGKATNFKARCEYYDNKESSGPV